jgi:hypothetical protein
VKYKIKGKFLMSVYFSDFFLYKVFAKALHTF